MQLSAPLVELLLAESCVGSSIATFATPVGVRFPFEAKILAMEIAVNKAFELQDSPLWVESDSTYVVRLLQ